ncbi:MAG: hypothetical protein ACOC6H_04490 [Thermoproteota archaeon]
MKIPEEDVEMEILREYGETLRVKFKLCNEMTWWNKWFISRASNPVFKGTLISKKGETYAYTMNDQVTAIVYPGRHITRQFKFRYSEKLKELIIHVRCEEGTLKKILHVKNHLRKRKERKGGVFST